MAYKVNLDNMILVLIPEGKALFSVMNAFCVNDGYSFEEAQEAIEKLGDEKGIHIRIGTLRGRLDTIFSENQRIKSLIDKTAFIIVVLISMICVTVQVLNIYLKRNEFGIWLASGMYRKDIFEILWMENIIKFVVGAIIAVILESFLLKILFSDSRSVYCEIVSMMYGRPLMELVVVALLLVCIISVIPIVIIAKRSTTDLVKGVWK
jgi:ABC-type antimicrobial peptide transport system permease subunit